MSALRYKHAGGGTPAPTKGNQMLLDHNTKGPPSPAQSAALVAAIAEVTAAGFTPFVMTAFIANGHAHVASVETAPNTWGSPAFVASVAVNE